MRRYKSVHPNGKHYRKKRARHRLVLQKLRSLRRIKVAGAAILSTKRSVLHYRVAAHRTSATTYRKSSVTGGYGVLPTPEVGRLQRVWSAAVSRGVNPLQIGGSQSDLGFEKLFGPARLQAAEVALLSGVRSLLHRRTVRVGRSSYFFTPTRRVFLRGLDFSRACKLYTRFRQQTPFDSHRPRLWDRLTLR